MWRQRQLNYLKLTKIPVIAYIYYNSLIALFSYVGEGEREKEAEREEEGGGGKERGRLRLLQEFGRLSNDKYLV